MPVAPGTEDQVAPESFERSHWYEGSGRPVEAAWKVSVPPRATVWFWGWAVTPGVRLARPETPLPPGE